MTLISCSTRINHFPHKFRTRLSCLLCVCRFFWSICVHCSVCNHSISYFPPGYSKVYDFSEVNLVKCQFNEEKRNNFEFACFIVSTVLSPSIIKINWKKQQTTADNRKKEFQLILWIVLNQWNGERTYILTLFKTLQRKKKRSYSWTSTAAEKKSRMPLIEASISVHVSASWLMAHTYWWQTSLGCHGEKTERKRKSAAQNHES